MKKIIGGLILLNINLVYGQSSYILFATTLEEKGTEIEFSTEYFQTQSVVDENSKAADLADGSSNQRLDFNFLAKYGITRQFEGMLGIRGRYIQSEFNFEGEDNKISRSGVESGVVGFKYSFKEVERTKYALEGWYRQALHSNKEYISGKPTDISLGDDTREYGIGVDFYFKTKSSNVLDAQVFYVSPGENLSNEVFSKIQYGLVWQHVSLYAGVENVISMENSPYEDDPENRPIYFQGSSFYFNSVNRQWTAPYIGMGIAMGKMWRMNARYAQVTTGQSTDLGPRVFISLTRRSETSVNQFAKRDAKFKQYRVEGVVTKMSKSRKVAVVDRGIEHGLKSGMKVDFYYFDFVGGNELIATGVVIKARASKSLVRVSKKLSRRRVEEGTVIRADELAGEL